MRKDYLRGMGRRLGRWACAALLAVVPLSPAHAQDSATNWQSALMAGNSRLALFSLRNARRPDLRQTAAVLAAQQGLGFPAGRRPQATPLQVAASPILTWDPNFNGGIPGETIMIGGLPFTVSEDSRAKAGAVVGASLTLGQNVVTRNGVVWAGNAGLTFRHAPEHDMSRTDLTLSVCRKQYQQRWMWIDLCLGGFYRSRAGTEEHELNGSARISKLFSLARTDAEIGLAAQGARRPEYRKAGLAVDGAMVLAGFGAVSARFSIGERVEGRNTLHQSLDLSLTRAILGAPTRFSIGYLTEDGSQLFGQVREDRVISLGMTRPLSRNLAVSVGLQDRDSTIDAYDEQSVNVGLNLTGWRN
ncbi:MAG: hypothetical protein ACRCSU_13060 [Paracoccaceae bacterium]